ncbi:hypothetical protein Tco_0718162 [Tanacetum coccineum]
MENVGLNFAQVLSKAHREGVGLRVADSHTGNHPEGGFTPFETIRRLLVVIGRRSHSGFEGETFEPKRREVLIRASRLKKVMADKGNKSSMETFAPNNKADYYSGITSITVNGKNAYELKGKFLGDPHNNAFSGTNGKQTKFPGAYHIGNSLHYQDLEWYEALEDRELKDEALRNKAIIEGLISDDESSNDCWKRWKSHEICYHDYDEGEYENETHEEEHELCGIKTREVSVCQIKRYKMIKYSFNNDKEYVAVKEDEYNDLTSTSEEACRAYQEIFRMMDEGWMVKRTE